MSAVSEVFLAGAILAQADRSDTPADENQRRAMAADLLGRARQAIAANDLDAAERLASQAEALGVQYGLLYSGDTPKKVRRDLELKRKSTRSPARPSQLFAPLVPGRNNSAPATDPFARQPGGNSSESLSSAALPDGRQVTPPAADFSSPIPSLAPDEPSPAKFGRAALPMSPAGETDSGLPPALERALSAGPPGNSLPGNSLPGNSLPGNGPAGQPGGSDLLRGARRALAVGDVRRAAGLVQQAKAQGGNYDPLQDSPDKIEAAIQKYQNLMARQNDSEGFRRAYAKMLMEQAQALLRSRDYDEAERLAVQASRQQLAFGPLEAKPEDLLAQILAARRQGDRPAPAPALGAAPAQTPAGPHVSASVRLEALEMVRQAREALTAGQLNRAEELARKAELLHLPDAAYGPQDNLPGKVLWDIRSARLRGAPSQVVPAGGFSGAPPAGAAGMDRTATRALYDAAHDPTRNIPAAATGQSPLPPPPRPLDTAQRARPPIPVPSAAPGVPGAEQKEADGMTLFRQGEEALKAHDKDRAYELYRRAAAHMNELDGVTAQRVKERLQLLSMPIRPAEAPNRSLADETASKQGVLARQVHADVFQQESKAKALRETDPKAALKLLEETRKRVEGVGLEPAAREQFLRRIDRALAETQQFIEQNRPRIELDERNNRVRQQVEREQRSKVEVQEKVKLMVDEFNRLMDEQRFAEAEVVAKRAAELAPTDPVIPQLLWQAKFVRRFMSNKALQGEKEDLVWKALDNVDQSSKPFDDFNPYQHGDAKQWAQLTKSRSRFLAERRRHRSEREMEIERKLRTPVSLQFTNAPLSKVMDYLAKIAEVNLYLDPQGLAQEGISSDQPVTIEVRHEIMLKSALNLILEPLHLSYVIKDEVLKITSEQLREGQVYTVTYSVADLVVPIPNFVPNQRMGLAGAYHDAMGNAGVGIGNGFGTVNPPLAVVASRDGTPSRGTINPAVLAQMSGAHAGAAPNMPLGFGPGGLGGGVQPDFDSLIDLITSTVHPSSWDAVGGPGTIARFEGNLSIVVSQTQEVHEEIADLLEQLRRLQDLQVTIEVRFITLNDNFFEKIGVDFDFNIDDNIDAKPGITFGRIAGPPPTLGSPPLRDTQDTDSSGGITVGLSSATQMSPMPTFSADLDIPFRQNSYGLAQPQFGGFDATMGATLGFAILSDIETFFFIQAVQGDKRSNVLQAPKVTLFNGQNAYVSDTSQTPFVISVIPVVGDFAAAQQPVIVVLSEGTHMSVQAVVSHDRRFVRLTVVPFFSKIGDVHTFQFTGSETTTTSTSAEGWVNGLDPNSNRRNNNSGNATTSRQGTTVQLPTFSYVTVTTTVSVPDGGTVLLGGIKRLREGRSEYGVPILNKLPYLNRLFKNVGIGRETQSLMMMVTPRIIIQEEEEEKMGIPPP